MTDHNATGEPEALIAYVTCDRIVPWKVLSLPSEEGADFLPVGFGSGQCVLPKRARKGTQLWVVTLPWYQLEKTKGIKAFPVVSLVARLEIEGVCSKDTPRDSPLRRHPGVQTLLDTWDWVAVASSPGPSRFFGLTNVNDELERLGIIEPGDLARDDKLRKRVGMRLQSVRIVKGGAAAAESEFTGGLERITRLNRQVFISFKSDPHYEDALNLALRLSELGFSCWLDTFALPGFSTMRKAGVSEDRLRDLLLWGVRQSDVAVAFVGEEYAREEDGWTEFEREAIQSRKESAAGDFFAHGILDGVTPDKSRDAAFHETGSKASIDKLIETLEGRFPLPSAAR